MINQTSTLRWCIVVFLLCCCVVDSYSRGNTISNENYSTKKVTVSGKVSDAEGPLPSVIVKLKGTNTSTSTNANGNYSLTIPDGTGTLVFSSIGYVTQEVAVQNRTTINVTLVAENKTLSEVIVVGYGTQKKSDITGSIVSISEQALKDVPVANLSQALQGRGAGIDIQKSGGNSKPGASPVIRIRGARSLGATNDPLFVVDGIPYNGNINDLNPDDVVSVEVLKDASSTAIYGSRGANGVILVTTKRGKIGEAVVTYSGYAGVTKNLGKIDVMDGKQFEMLKKWAVVNGNFVSGAPKYTGVDDPRIMTDGIFAPQELESIKMGRSTDWQDLIYKNGITTNHQIGVSGGSEKTQYALSGGYHNETGIYPGQSFERFTAKISIEQQLGKYVRVGLNSINNFSYTKGEGANPMGQVLRASPLATPYDETGKLWGFVPGSANQVWNPLGDFVEGAKIENRKRFGTFTTLYLEATLAPGLKYRFNGGAEIKSDVYGNFYASATSNNLGGLSTSSNRTGFRTDYTLENLLTYDKVIADHHKINFTGLFSLQEAQSQSNSFNNNNLIADNVWYYNPQLGSNLVGSGDYSKWSLISYMGRLNYGFKDKYLLTLTMRSDGSSRLAPGGKYKVFPSAAVAWNLIQEDFIKSVGSISNLKLRGSYGMVGNTSIDAYATLGALTGVNYNFGDKTTTGLYLSNVPNPALTWENSTTANVAVDFGFLKNRITGSIEAYHVYTDKLLLPQNLPFTSGIPNAVLTNVGKSENRGLEFQVSTVNIDGDGKKKFSWSTDINVSINRGKITQLQEGVINDITNNRFVGQPIGTIYDYNRVGIWQNTPADTAEAKRLGLTVTTGTGSVIGNIRLADTNGDGKITADDRIFIGSSQPKWSGGMTHRFAYKNLDFTVVTFGRFGSTIISSVHNSGFANTFQGNYNNLDVNYWTPTNHENYWPKPNAASTNTPNNSTLGYFDGTFVKIRSLALGYNLPAPLAAKIGGRSLRVYASVNDAFILFSKYRNIYKGIDPEAISGSNNRSSVGVDTPASYSMTFGLNMSL
ncbi:SusC/RagA family TonB-linked outer membrane protein [Pedobacter heparinus]|uniref:TonB-dependent receptor plug n=1 Tax=Pedobacter heparinus (strain ATCC 13125 / DSM 2366 / CIP 104194 / JCM 7457 / NBRC 12017 / NCIMB 9290 / NRRL B-14731 / HIM 762-3) TaxID=485917 RepID=C6XUR9_PEDHD|nr:TonB-dependent receptor [Pedobacter heparinus]ACU03919.1 TonB-dependent receptor plug [Pedobacter heparinus DSM 2366]